MEVDFAHSQIKIVTKIRIEPSWRSILDSSMPFTRIPSPFEASNLFTCVVLAIKTLHVDTCPINII